MIETKESPDTLYRYNILLSEGVRLNVERGLASLLSNRFPSIMVSDTDHKGFCLRVAEDVLRQVVAQLLPDMVADVSVPRMLCYKNDLLSAERCDEVLFQVIDLMKHWGQGLRSSQTPDERAMTIAMLVVDMVVCEIAHEILDSPIIYSPTITQALNLVAAYLRAAIIPNSDLNDEACERMGKEVLYLIVRMICPRYIS